MSDTEVRQSESSNPPARMDAVPVAVVRRKRVSAAWLVPLMALVVVGYVLWAQVARDRGVMITIDFADAGGLEPGSEIIHRGVTVGVVREMSLSNDLQTVSVHAELRPDAEGLAVQGTQFWVVRPEVSLQRIAGLETLVGPQYVALQPGNLDGEQMRTFVALDSPPRIAPVDDEALRLTLRSGRLGNISAGSPVLFREIVVGVVRGAHLGEDATGVEITVDIDPRYAPLVYENTRFWRSGGVVFDFGIFSGLSVQADSLDALITASISFATPENEKRRGGRAARGGAFELHDSVDEDWLQWAPVLEYGVESDDENDIGLNSHP